MVSSSSQFYTTATGRRPILQYKARRQNRREKNHLNSLPQSFSRLAGSPGTQLEEAAWGYMLLARRFCRCKRSAQTPRWSPAAWPAPTARRPSRWGSKRAEIGSKCSLGATYRTRSWKQFRRVYGCAGTPPACRMWPLKGAQHITWCLRAAGWRDLGLAHPPCCSAMGPEELSTSYCGCEMLPIKLTIIWKNEDERSHNGEPN